MNSEWQLAQINIGRIRGITMDDPIMNEFVRQRDEINSLAERGDGFVWRLKDESDNPNPAHPFDDNRIIVNMSVWESIEQLESFAYNGRHLEVYKSRSDWFEKMDKRAVVLWYVPVGHRPTIEEAKFRLKHLEENGPTAFAFDFRKKFTKP